MNKSKLSYIIPNIAKHEYVSKETVATAVTSDIATTKELDKQIKENGLKLEKLDKEFEATQPYTASFISVKENADLIIQAASEIEMVDVLYNSLLSHLEKANKVQLKLCERLKENNYEKVE